MQAAFAAWTSDYNTAMGNTAELEKKEREEPNEIERLMGVMEQGLELLGSTAIEDKLQA